MRGYIMKKLNYILIFIMAISVASIFAQEQEKGSDVLKVAKEKLDAEKYEEVVDILEKVVKKHKDLFDAYFMLGNAYYKLGEYDKAIENAEKSIELKKDFIPAYLIEVNSFEKKSKYEDAEAKLKEAMEIKPDEPLLNTKLGEIYQMQGKLDDAISQYIKSYKLDKKMTDSIFKAIQIYMEKKNYKSALEILDKIEDDMEKDEDKQIWEQLKRDCEYNILIIKAEELFNSKKIKDSIDKYREARDIKATDINLDVKIAECYYLLKEIDDANEILDNILRKHKNHSGALKVKAEIFYFQKQYK